MNFVEYPFLFIFLPLLLLFYYCICRIRNGEIVPRRGKGRLLLLLLASYLFYAWSRIDFLLLLLFVTLFDYTCSKWIARSENLGRRRMFLAFSIINNLLVLGYFKYFNFGMDCLNKVFPHLGLGTMAVSSIFLPIGLSFYIFESISYVVDVYRRETRPASSILEYASFIAFFPHLVAGPIIRYKDIGSQLLSGSHELSELSRGVLIFMMGFCKKVLIADSLAPVADAVFDGSQHGFTDAWLGVLSYSLQLYFDFSGYADMAVGLAGMFGFQFPKNFEAPYRAESITDFWRRWHISLSNWLRDYLYIPLGGNRSGPIRTYANLLITMFLGGIWHGANWTFALWGLYHGILLCFERFKGKQAIILLPWRWGNRIVTFLLVMVGWAIFRSTDGHVLSEVFRGLSGLNGLEKMASLEPFIRPTGLLALFFSVLLIVFSPTSWSMAEKTTWPKAVLFFVLFLAALGKLILTTYRPFLYFQF